MATVAYDPVQDAWAVMSHNLILCHVDGLIQALTLAGYRVEGKDE